MKFQINEKWKKIIFIIAIVAVIELSGYGFFASIFRLTGSLS